MKKVFYLVATAVVALTMTSCMSKLVGDAKKATAEWEEVTSGKIFEVKSATVTYNNGKTLYFNDYGKQMRVDENGEPSYLILTEGSIVSYYEFNNSEKTYYKQTNDVDAAYGYWGAEFCFFKETIQYEKSLLNYDSSASIKETTETIAGKSCTVFTFDGEKMGGWKRVLMLEEDEEEEDLRALTLVESAPASVFAIPAGYTEETY